MKKGVLLINLGTPNSPKVADVKRYLKEFLTDPRVIDLPAVIRYCLVYGLIVPFRAKKSAKAYASIWTPDGSPLAVHSQNLVHALQAELPNYTISLGMRYGLPSIESALCTLEDCDELTIIPLYPQYASASTGSSIEKVLEILKKKQNFPSIKLIRDFHDDPGFIAASAKIIEPYLQTHDHLLLSYHGLPERQLIKGGCQSICQGDCPIESPQISTCYRAQCYRTSSQLASTLGLSKVNYTTSFQSRLGKTPWIKPFTDETLESLAAQGIKNLAIACPSFVADCLETLEEIAIRGQEQWTALGGEKLSLIPSLNTTKTWICSLSELIERK